MGGATILRMGYKTILQAERAEIYLVCDILGYISHKLSQNGQINLFGAIREFGRGQCPS